MRGRHRQTAVLTTLFALGFAACSGKSPGGNPTGPPPSGPPPPPAPTTYDVDALGVPRFASSDYIDLGAIQRISRFRSAVGHETRDDFEACRSMKHYFQPKASVDWSAVAIFAPVAGTVDTTRQEAAGLQVVIRSSTQPAFTLTIFHLNPSLTLTQGTTLSAGQRLGTHIGSQTMSDIAVDVATPRGRKLVSWFQVMSDSVFQAYAARGVTSREAAIITQAERDADPLRCNGETFTSAGSGAIPDWLVLR
jgi:hypothetical protein